MRYSRLSSTFSVKNVLGEASKLFHKNILVKAENEGAVNTLNLNPVINTPPKTMNSPSTATPFPRPDIFQSKSTSSGLPYKIFEAKAIENMQLKPLQVGKTPFKLPSQGAIHSPRLDSLAYYPEDLKFFHSNPVRNNIDLNSAGIEMMKINLKNPHFIRPSKHFKSPQVFKAQIHGIFEGKGIVFGDQVSKVGKNKTRRTWKPNIQRATLYSEALGVQVKSLRVTAAALKMIDKMGGLDNYLTKFPIGHFETSLIALRLRQRILDALFVRKTLNIKPAKALYSFPLNESQRNYLALAAKKREANKKHTNK